MKIVNWLLVVCLCLTSCQAAPRKRPPPSVLTAKVEKRDVPIYFDTIGQTIPPVTVNVRPQVGGKLLHAYIQQGADVKKDQLLYEIDPRPFQAALDQAKAQLNKDRALLEYAESAVKRYKKVVDEDFISILNYEQTISNAESLRAQVEVDKALIVQAELNLEFSKVFAPTDGKISYFNIDVGNIVVANDPNAITVIRPYLPIDVNFSLAQMPFELVRNEQGNQGEWQFIVTTPDDPKTEFKGVSYFIDNQIDPSTGTILIRGTLSNLNRVFWPGEFVRVRVLYKIAPQALVVPPGAVLTGREGPYVYIVGEDHKVKNVNIHVLTKEETFVAFTSDLIKEGDLVVTDGQINISPNMEVDLGSTK